MYAAMRLFTLCASAYRSTSSKLARRIGRYGLIGFGESYMAGDWESDALAELLTVLAADLTDLGKALSARGYEVEPVAGPNLGRTQLSHRVQRFLAQARSDDRLLIVLSGHGVHIDGRDYLFYSGNVWATAAYAEGVGVLP